MFHFSLGNYAYRGWFKHSTVNSDELPGWMGQSKNRSKYPRRTYRKTTCFLAFKMKTGEESPIFMGESVCSPSDAFRKSIGRKCALTRAASSFSRADRATIWAEYLKQCAPKVQAK